MHAPTHVSSRHPEPPVSAATTIGFSRAQSADRKYVAARRREELREFGSQLSDDQELSECGRKIRKGPVGSATEVLTVTKSCRRKWLCPTCGDKASRKETAQLKRRLLGWTAQGHAVAFLTLTQAHDSSDRLAALWDRLQDGWAALVTGSGWTADKQAYGVRGYVRITEVVHSATGWHVHFHVILLLDRELDQSGLNILRASLTTRFARGVARSGGHATVLGQDLEPMAPGTEGRLAFYCFKGTTIDRSRPTAPGPQWPSSMIWKRLARGWLSGTS
jgi:hypothetical protein